MALIQISAREGSRTSGSRSRLDPSRHTRGIAFGSRGLALSGPALRLLLSASLPSAARCGRRGIRHERSRLALGPTPERHRRAPERLTTSTHLFLPGDRRVRLADACRSAVAYRRIASRLLSERGLAVV